MSKLKVVIKEIEELSGTNSNSGDQYRELCKQLELLVKENIGEKGKWSIVSPKSTVIKALNLMVNYITNARDIINSVLINLTNVLMHFVTPGTDKEIRSLCLTLLYKTTIASLSASVPFQFWSEIYKAAFQIPKDSTKIVKIGSLEKITINDLYENFNTLLNQINWKDSNQFSYWWNIIAASAIPIIYSYKDTLGDSKIQNLSVKLLDLIVNNLSVPSPIHVIWQNSKIEQRSLFGNPEDVRAFIVIMLNYPTYDNVRIKENPTDTLLQDAFTFIFGCTTFCHNNEQNIDQPASYAEFKLAASSSKSVYTLFTHFTFKATDRVISIIKLFRENCTGPLFFMKLFSQAYTLYQKLVLETSKHCTQESLYRTMCHMNTCLAMFQQMLEVKTSTSDDEGLLSIMISNVLDDLTVNSCVQFLIQVARFGVNLSYIRQFPTTRVSEYFLANFATFIACASFPVTSRVSKDRLRKMNTDLELMVQNPVFYAVEFLSIPLLEEYRQEYKQCLGFLPYFSFDGMEPFQVIDFVNNFLRAVDEQFEGTAIAAYSQAWVKIASLVRGAYHMQYIGDTILPALINMSKQQHFRIHFIFSTIGFIVCHKDRFSGCPMEERDALFRQLLSGVTVARVNKKMEPQSSTGAFDVITCAIRLIDLDNDYSFALMPFVANAIRKINPTYTSDIKSLNLFIRAITDITVAGLTTDNITIPESLLELARTPLLNRPSRESLIVGQTKPTKTTDRIRTLTAGANSNTEPLLRIKPGKPKKKESHINPPKEFSGEILLQWASEFLEAVECSHLLEAMDLEAAVMRLFIEVIAGTDRGADDNVFTLLPTRIPFASRLLFKMLQILPQFYPQLIKRAPCTLQKFASSLTQISEVSMTESTVKHEMNFAADILLVTDDEVLSGNCLSILSTEFSNPALTAQRDASIDYYITTKYNVPGRATLDGGVEIVSNNQKHSMSIKHDNGGILVLVQNEQGSNLYHLNASDPIKEDPIADSIFGWQPPTPLLVNSVMLSGKNVRKGSRPYSRCAKPLKTSLVFLGSKQTVREAFLNPWQKVTKGFKAFVEGLGTPKKDKKVHWKDNRRHFEAAIIPLMPESERSMAVTSRSSVIIYNGHDSDIDISEPLWDGLKFIVVVSPAHEGLLRIQTRYFDGETSMSLDPTPAATAAYGPIRETAIVSNAAACALLRCTMFTAVEA